MSSIPAIRGFDRYDEHRKYTYDADEIVQWLGANAKTFCNIDPALCKI